MRRSIIARALVTAATVGTVGLIGAGLARPPPEATTSTAAGPSRPSISASRGRF